MIQSLRSNVETRWSATSKAVDEIVARRFAYRHELLDREELEESEEEGEGEASAPPKRVVIRAATCPPQDIIFTVPEDARAGQPVCVQGPHGPILIPLPEEAEPGKEFSWRLGPNDHYSVDVPEDLEEGGVVEFKGMHNETLHAVVPEGKKGGDTFMVSPPVIMVQVPQNAKPGQELTYMSPLQLPMLTRVPEGMSPGQYFPALYELPKEGQAPHQAQVTESPNDKTDESPSGEGPTEEDQLIVE